MGLFKKGSSATLAKVYLLDGTILGRGNYATVVKASPHDSARVCRRKDGTLVQLPLEVAVKSIEKASVSGPELRREISVMQALSGHAHIIDFFEVFDEPRALHLVLELLSGGSLFERIVATGFYTESQAAATLAMLCSALDFVHSRGIVHRDVKPENIMYATAAEDAPIKLVDFGTSILRGEPLAGNASALAGTPSYVAPEILRRTGLDDPAWCGASARSHDLWAACPLPADWLPGS